MTSLKYFFTNICCFFVFFWKLFGYSFEHFWKWKRRGCLKANKVKTSQNIGHGNKMKGLLFISNLFLKYTCYIFKVHISRPGCRELCSRQEEKINGISLFTFLINIDNITEDGRCLSCFAILRAGPMFLLIRNIKKL